MFWDLLKARIWPISLLIFCSFIAAMLGLLVPYFQKEFIDQLTGHEGHFHLFQMSPSSALFYSFLCLLGQLGFHQLTFYLGFKESLSMQRQLAQKIYDKVFSLNIETQSQRPVGEIVSLYATDVSGATIIMDQSFPQGASTFIPLLLAPFALSLLFEIPILPLIFAMLAISGLSLALAYRQAIFFYRFKTLAAERIGLVNEWIQNIRTFKILSWLESFENLIIKKRKDETTNRVAMVSNGQTMNTLSSTFTFFLNLFAILLLMQKYRLSQTSSQEIILISPGEILALLWIVGIFLTKPFRQMPWFFTFAFDSWTSTQRLKDFFATENKTTPKNNKQKSIQHFSSRTNSSDENALALDVRELSLQIDDSSILKNLHFSLEKGKKLALVGEIGSGKTLTLLSLLGETGATSKNLKVFGEELGEMPREKRRSLFSFVSQEGFVLSASLGQNVTFDFTDHEQHEDKILDKLRLAEFSSDLSTLPYGLATEVGERGVNLSGGQRQRINIARGLFFDRPILLFDDCFSALDIDTEKKLVKNLFHGDMKEKTMIISTHRLSLLEEVDEVIFLVGGEIEIKGSYQELLSQSSNFRKFTESLRSKIPSEKIEGTIV